MSEKTEKATPKQEREAREKGQVGKSEDLVKLLILLVVSEIALGLADASVDSLKRLMGLSLQRMNEPFAHTVGETASDACVVLISFIALSVGMAMLMRLVGSWMQFGFLFAPKALAPDLGKLNPINQIKHMFSGQNISTLLLSIVKASMISVVLYLIAMPALRTLILLANTDLSTYWHGLLELFRRILRTTIGMLLVLAVADFVMQKYFHAKKLRMSKDDIKKEYKEAEGDPHIKGHRRQLAHQLANEAPKAPPKPVEQADMLVVNPTHFAVALFYRPGKTPLPLIHCKGLDEDALELIERAHKAKVPVVQCVWLARLLYKTDTGRHIPRQTLQAVAQIYQVIKQLDEVTDEVIQMRDLQ